MLETLVGFPVNENGEILVVRGTGSAISSGVNPTGVPSKDGNTISIVDANEERIGGWKFLQDGRYTSSSPLILLENIKTKITLDLTQIAYQAGSGLTVNYDDVSDKFMPTVAGSAYMVTFRGRFTPAQNGGSIDLTLESPGFTFNPLVGRTSHFNKSGVENFLSVTETLFVDESIIPLGIEFYIKPLGANVNLYDYSILVQRTYLPL